MGEAVKEEAAEAMESKKRKRVKPSSEKKRAAKPVIRCIFRGACFASGVGAGGSINGS